MLELPAPSGYLGECQVRNRSPPTTSRRGVRGGTLLVVAHRLSTVIASDQILVLEKGKIVGRGTHEELVASTALYRELAEHQLLTHAEG